MELCLAGVGGNASAHPDFLEQKLNRRQIVDWIAYYRIRRFGAERDDMRQAVATYWHVTAAMLSAPDYELPDDHSPEKYKLKFAERHREPTEAEQILEDIRAML